MSRFPGIMLVLAVACLNTHAGVKERFVFGVNGHPGVQDGYKQVPVETQLDLVNELGANWYRCDWYQTRLEKDPEFYDRLVGRAAERGIHVLPVIFPAMSCRTNQTPEQIREASFSFAKGLASRFGNRITHWELDNELDARLLVRKGEITRTGVSWRWGAPDGDKPEHYHEGRYRRAVAELAGLHEGIKAGNPKALTIVDAAGWLHYGFFERLVKEDAVTFDILGWHWYSEMGDMTKVRGRFNVLEQLKGYGKSIWITELNRRGGSKGGKEVEQAGYLKGVSLQMRAYPGVEACFTYELLDEPHLGQANEESHYGLVTLTRGPDALWRVDRKKPAFLRFREVINAGAGDGEKQDGTSAPGPGTAGVPAGR